MTSQLQARSSQHTSQSRRRRLYKPPDTRLPVQDPKLVQEAEESSDLRALVFLSASGGVGLSTCSALCAQAMAERRHSCALVDADFTGGGLDVLLGLESEPGLRFAQVEAPLGQVDPAALDHELPRWRSVSLLSSDSWNGGLPQWWDVDAAIRAMGSFYDLLLVDAADGSSLSHIESLAQAPCVLVTELSVLGLARTRALLSRLEAAQAGRRQTVLLGMRVGRRRSQEPVSPEDAEDFLGLALTAVLEPNQRIKADIVNGLGIGRIPRHYRKALAALGQTFEELLALETTDRGKRK